MAVTTEILPLLGELLTEMGHAPEPEADLGAITFTQLGLDSLELLEFLMLVDERTGIEITTDTTNFDTTLAQLAEQISQLSA